MKTIIYLFIVILTVNTTNITHASWYGDKFHGKVTANGETYNQYDLTTASPSLPFNTIIKITNIDNNKSVIVRVNDRGPYQMYKNGKVVRPLKPHPKRKFDLSRKAFSKIANINKGIIKIKYEILKPNVKHKGGKRVGNN